jgi:hypothetical protein
MRNLCTQTILTAFSFSSVFSFLEKPAVTACLTENIPNQTPKAAG